MNKMEKEKEILKGRLRDIFEYHLDEFVNRLIEIGGFGVGGIELEYRPHVIEEVSENNKENMVIMALQNAIPKFWQEANLNYVHGHFISSILLSATLLEATLKLELSRKGLNWPGGLGGCISRCGSNKNKGIGIISSEIEKYANEIKEARENIIHLLIHLKRPKDDLFYEGEEHEKKQIISPSRNLKNHAITGDGEVIQILTFPLNQPSTYNASVVYPYKKIAKKLLDNLKQILKYLYEK